MQSNMQLLHKSQVMVSSTSWLLLLNGVQTLHIYSFITSGKFQQWLIFPLATSSKTCLKSHNVQIYSSNVNIYVALTL